MFQIYDLTEGEEKKEIQKKELKVELLDAPERPQEKKKPERKLKEMIKNKKKNISKKIDEKPAETNEKMQQTNAADASAKEVKEKAEEKAVEETAENNTENVKPETPKTEEEPAGIDDEPVIEKIGGPKEKRKKKAFRRQSIYAKSLGMIKNINDMYDAMESIGVKLDFEDDKTAVGKAMSVMLTNPKEIACEALGLTLKEEPGYCVGIDENHLIPIKIDVYYPESENVEFSLTFESMWDVLDAASKDAVYAKHVWDCFVNEREEDREWLIKEGKVYGFGEMD